MDFFCANSGSESGPIGIFGFSDLCVKARAHAFEVFSGVVPLSVLCCPVLKSFRAWQFLWRSANLALFFFLHV